MRVAVACPPWLPVPPPKYGGTERVVYYLIKGLQELGHQVTLFAPGDSQINCRLIPTVPKSLGFAVNHLSPARQKLYHQTEQLVIDYLNSHAADFDIVHAHWMDMHGLNTLPSVTTIHSPVTLYDLDYYLSHRDLNWVTISKNQSQVFTNFKIVDTVYHGLDPSEFPFNPTPQEYLAWVGRFHPDKQPHLAIQLAIALNRKIKLAGNLDSADKPYYRKYCAKLMTHPLVEYVGELGMPQKAEFIGQAFCNLHPTGFREPFGLTVIEAAFCGTPTLAINRGSLPELVETGKTGLVVEDFTEGFFKFDQLKSIDRQFVAARAAKMFHYHTMTADYLRVYQSVISAFN